MHVVVTTVAEDREAARRLAARWLDAGAGCVQIEAIESVYRWHGDLNRDGELRLTLKVADEGLDNLLDRIRRDHPYDEPQLVWFAASASEGYERFLRNADED